MTEQKRITGLAEQIELARRYQEQLPEWLRSNAHFSGSNHASDLESDDEVGERRTTRGDNRTA